MKQKSLRITLILVVAVFFGFWGASAFAAKPIVIGAPLSTAYLYGWDAERGIKLAVDEINEAGGVTVKRGEKAVSGRSD